MNGRGEGLSVGWILTLGAGVVVIFFLCVCLGSVSVPLSDIFAVFARQLSGAPASEIAAEPIILSVRLPRVLSAGLVGASLSLCGATMQGLLRNPLADVSTLGVSSGACVGAVLAIVTGITLPGLGGNGIMPMAILFSFFSLILILSLANRLDYSFSTNTILLIGIVFSMFAQSLISLMVAFAGDKVQSAVMWTMGSMAGSNYYTVALLAGVLAVCGGVVLRYGRELNAFAIGEDNARHVGIDVKRVKLVLLVSVSIITGVCVSAGGTIAFVGLIIPHITRLLTGPNHKRLLPASLLIGAGFLMLGDLLARVLVRPVELPIGVVTSIIGAFVFIQIFYTIRKAG